MTRGHAPMMDFSSLVRSAPLSPSCTQHIMWHIYIYIYIFIYTPKKDRHPRCGEVRRVVPGWLMLLLLLCNLVPAGKADWPAARHVNKITFTILYATWLVVCMAFIGVYMFCRCHVEKSYVGRNNWIGTSAKSLSSMFICVCLYGYACLEPETAVRAITRLDHWKKRLPPAGRQWKRVERKLSCHWQSTKRGPNGCHE